MKRQFIQFFIMLSFVSFFKAQELGKVIIMNEGPNYPRFIASLNGVRISNDYQPLVCFDYLEEKNYKVKILVAGSSKPLYLMVNSAPNYVSKYILAKDNYGTYNLVLESKVLMGANQPEIIDPGNNPLPNEVYLVAMRDNDYNDMLKSVKKESMESSKLEMAKTFFGSQNLSSIQVLGILKIFSMESTKLNFAKFAYSRTIDKQNYYKAYDAFSMSSSKKEMSEYIKNNP